MTSNNSRNPRQPTTLVDVAARASVSIKTVSRVINNEPYVGEATRQRVLKAIQELNYHPNRAARSLASSRSRIIGLLIPSIANPFFPPVIMGVTRVMHEHGYDVLMYSTDIAPQRSRKGLKLLEENHVDGVIMCAISGVPDSELKALIDRHNAAVLINMVLPGSRAGVVRVDDASGIETIVRYLVAKGRRRLAFLTYPVAKHSTRERLRSYRQSLEAHQIPLDESLIVTCAIDTGTIYDTTRRLLLSRPDVDAIICYNDMMAAVVLKTCMELDIAVPDKVAVTGFDNIPYTDLFKHSLTTVDVPKLELGIKAAELLLERIKGNFTVSEIVVTPQLIVRESTP
ncbi:MAG TPA: LacI family DNA-binding transcriptional regulator [Spirillospora sp.]|nr:LacI family DNA-binding transcriptional regulator [Spirillospora sp.]